MPSKLKAIIPIEHIDLCCPRIEGTGGTMENSNIATGVSELGERLKRTQEKLEDAEDELAILLERSNSGQHTSSKYIQSNRARIEQDIESLKDTIKKITAETASGGNE
jgi:hypothetical protein